MSGLKISRRNMIAAAVVMAAACFVVNVGVQAFAQHVNKKVVKKEKEEETYTRPKPSRPIKPEIPGANRYQEDKIFLEYADSLFKTPTRDTIEKQILKGNVKFRQAGMWMYCDLAYYYPELNSLDAFGNVRMEQGDTLFVYADKLFYDGNERLAKLKNGFTRDKVKLINRDVTLTTDSLDYDLGMELGWYSQWGTIDDKVNTLTSLYGEYSPGTKNADFYHDVKLVNNKDGFIMLTDTLHYNTDTHIARIESLTEIQGANDTIVTRRGLYNTQIGDAELLSRSMIIHRDSNNNVTTLEGDSILYDKQTRISRAYMFRDPLKHGMPMVLTDTAHKTTLIGGFGIYNDSTREALACEYPLLMEYSQPDTIFLRADTIKTFIVTAMVAANRRWTLSGYPEKDGVPIIKADSSGFWLDSLFFSLVVPYVQKPLQLLSAAIANNTDSKNDKQDKPLPRFTKNTPDAVPMTDADSLSVADADSLHFVDKIQPDNAWLTPDNDSLIAADATAANDTVANDAIKNEISSQKVEMSSPTDSVPKDSIPKYPKDFHVALAYYRARFFKQDIQGVADSMVFVEQDSMLYMFRKPIVWSGERQVTGNRIDVHFNDSTADHALLPEFGLMSEYIDEDFYNQLAGKTMLATFGNQTLRRLDVSGNVETIFLPQEKDSTFNRLINAESSFLTIELDSGKMDKLKMWPEVSGTVTPIFLVKNSQKYLQKFRWWATLRPEREWYGDRLHWADNLGEVPDALEQYFLAPSDFGEPKSFSGTRFVAPPSSLPSVGDAHYGNSMGGESVFVTDSVTAEAEEEITLPDIEENEQEMNTENAEAEEEATTIEEALENNHEPEASEELNGKEQGIRPEEQNVKEEEEGGDSL